MQAGEISISGFTVSAIENTARDIRQGKKIGVEALTPEWRTELSIYGILERVEEILRSA